MGIPQGFKQSSPGAPTATAPRPGTPLPGANSTPGMISLAHSLENVEESSRLETGMWPAVVEDVNEVTASTGSQGIEFKLRFLNFEGVATINPNDGRSGKHTVYVTPKALWKVKNSFCAVGQCDAITQFNKKAAIGVLVMVDVTANKYLPNDREDIPENYVTTSKCDSIIGWPVDKGGPGARLQ